VSIAIQAETDRESKRRPGIKSKLNAYLDERRRRARMIDGMVTSVTTSAVTSLTTTVRSTDGARKGGGASVLETE